MRGPQGLVCEAGRPLMWPEGVSADLCASIAIHEWTEKESGFEGEKKRRRKGKRKRKKEGWLQKQYGKYK